MGRYPYQQKNIAVRVENYSGSSNLVVDVAIFCSQVVAVMIRIRMHLVVASYICCAYAFSVDVIGCFTFTAYMSSPCHIEIILSEREDAVAKPDEEEPVKKKESKKKLKRQKLTQRD